jgi:uncharacterized membrane protein YphA (DoxX/SURF4 family)
VRTKPLIGEKAWFGPKSFGWGLTPVSWEGWVLTAGVVVLCVAVAVELPERTATAVILGVAAVYTVLAHLKGTSPGGRRVHQQYLHDRDERGRS